MIDAKKMFYFSWLTRSQEVHTSHSLGLHKSRHRLSCIYVEIVTLTPETLIMCSVCSNAFHRFIGRIFETEHDPAAVLFPTFMLL